MTHNAGEGTTSETKPINPPELHPCNSPVCDALLRHFKADRDHAVDQLAEALAEVRTLRSIIDEDNGVEQAYLDAFKRYPSVNAADNRRAE